MASTAPEGADSRRKRRRLTAEIKDTLREVSVQLALLNRRVGLKAELRDVDLDCLEIVNRYGPLSPSAIAQRAGLHPATTTGVLDRLERGGWIVRERDTTDRRAVAVRSLRDRGGQLFALYSGMNSAMDQVCADYTDAELERLAEFLRRTADAGRSATEKLAGD